MNLDRNQIIGIFLIFAIIYAWSMFNAPSEADLAEAQRIQDSIAFAEVPIPVDRAPQDMAEAIPRETHSPKPDSSQQAAALQSKLGPFAAAGSGEEQLVTLENDVMAVTFSSLGGRITDAHLKEYSKILLDTARVEYKVPLHLLDDEKNVFEYLLPVAGARGNMVSSGDLYFDVKQSSNSVVFTSRSSDGLVFKQTYSLTPGDYTLDYDLDFENADLLARNGTVKLNWINNLDKVEKNYGYEKYYTSVYFKPVDDAADYCNCRGDDTEEHEEKKFKWVSHSNQFFNTSLIADERFGGGTFESEMMEDEDENLKILRTNLEIPLDGRSSESFGMTIYIGPNEFDRLYAFGNGLQDVIPFGRSIFGTINRWVIRPMFNLLLDFIPVKGLVILALTFIVKVVLYPLTYKMLYSQAKMSALKPRLAGMREKFKDDTQKQQMESMKVYREYGVSPLGGCLPMVAQMPIWFALYRFFPAAIEFRQADFLWATDLSSYDVFANLPWEIPFYGAHVSLITILWAGTTVIYTYYNTKHMDMGSMNPMMKYMQYFMPIMFLFFFNNYASGLTLYLLFSNVLNIGLTIGTKKWIFNDKKILADLDAYKAQPKKKKKSGGFQERLEKAMKQQQRSQELAGKKKKGAKKASKRK